MRPHRLIVSLVPALAAVGLTLVGFGADWTAPRTWLVGAVGFGLAAAAALWLGQSERRGWKLKLAQASTRLAEFEARTAPAGDDAVRALADQLFVPEEASDTALEDALTGLEAALTDERRLRERRESITGRVAEALRSARDFAGAEGDTGKELSRLANRLEALETSAVAAREASDSTLARSIACDEVARLVDEHVKTGRDAGKRANEDAGELDQQIEIVTKLVRRLEARSREIGEVLLVLNDITEQTSLLALNAAIIAAQAGEQGKGFGVVADEMRNLSERAFSSTKETEMLAQTLRDDVGQAVRSMGEAGDTLRDLRLALGEAGEASAILSDVGGRTAETARATVADAERQAGALREAEGHLRALAEQRERLGRLERETIAPGRELLARMNEILEGEWNAGALRDSLRRRLDDAVAAIREHRGRDARERERLETRFGSLRESGRRLSEAIEENRRREELVRDVARDIRQLAHTPEA
ncbi:MAG: methyl-accepting chemotaxis protein [bacterium]